MRIEHAGRTDPGRVRGRNEDALLQCPDRRLFAVADGMGGHAAGDVASRTAVEVFDRMIGPTSGAPPGQRLAEAIRAAHEAILDAGRANPRLSGMGTTLTALWFPPGQDGVLAHVGDSRAYRLRSGALQQLTRDQTWIQDQIDQGHLTPHQARQHPFAAMLTGALGIPDLPLSVEVLHPASRPGDTYLLCSDGLVACLEDGHLADIVLQNPRLDDAAEALVAAANACGGPDNITVCLVRVSGE
jgi:PPM family protein phosphatase